MGSTARGWMQSVGEAVRLGKEAKRAWGGLGLSRRLKEEGQSPPRAPER